ncbi:hypothetical protein [Robertkochia sediminum]|uniref:hypothetical protein n=1 Tax=Robertkochia sediminum TaxID=2785326 RepID=UPI001932ACBC|nr:hypothetical protein [Robertkochia sediminum]MBL7473319.1 hypothetical protein [Robertkochia sediminum]
MNRIISILLLSLIFSCNYSYRDLDEGKWYEAENEIHSISIYLRNDSLYLKEGRETYLIHDRKYRDYIYKGNLKYPIWQENGKLMYDKKTFIPESQTITYKYKGEWVCSEENIRIISQSVGPGALEWKIKDSRNKNFTYYPKRKNDTLLITYLGEIIEFKHEGDYLIDSKNRKYLKQ